MNSFIINLEKRTDRWSSITERLKKVKCISPERVEAIYNEEGSVGCMLSHKKVVRLAKEMNLPYVILIEDDCVFADDFDERFPKALKEFLDSPFMIFNSGTAVIVRDGRVYNREKNLITSFCYTAQLLIIKNEVFDDILSNGTSPIDVFYMKNYEQLLTLPFLTTQLAGESDIQKRYIDYMAEFSQAQNKLQQILKYISS